MSINRKAPARQSTGLDHSQTLHNENSSTAQRARLLAALQRGPLTTFDARRELDVPHPAARVMELRRRGHRIVTHRCGDISEAGRMHHVARYVLMGDLS